MRVKDLIEKLQQFNPNLGVMVDGYEGGVDYPCDPVIANIKRDYNVGDGECPYYYGRHEIDRDSTEPVVYLARR